jgi:uncharacterized membrane protein YqjE
LAANGPHRANDSDPPIGDIVQRISENASLLVREEIELAKAEVEQKVKKLTSGTVAGAVAGFFVFIGMIFLLVGLAYGIDDLLNNGYLWAGFFIVAGLLFVLAVVGGLLAMRLFKAGAPPVPDQAIEEAKLIRSAIEHPEIEAAIARSRETTQQTRS